MRAISRWALPKIVFKIACPDPTWPGVPTGLVRFKLLTPENDGLRLRNNLVLSWCLPFWIFLQPQVRQEALSNEHFHKMLALTKCRPHTARWTFVVLYMMGIMHLEVFALVCKIYMTLVFRRYVKVQNFPHQWAGERPRICVFKQFVHIFSDVHKGDGADYPVSLQSCRWCVQLVSGKTRTLIFFDGVKICSTRMYQWNMVIQVSISTLATLPVPLHTPVIS